MYDVSNNVPNRKFKWLSVLSIEDEAIALTATREWHHQHHRRWVSEWVSTKQVFVRVVDEEDEAAMEVLEPQHHGEFVLFPRPRLALYSQPRSLRRSHVKCNVVAKPTITHRRLTHTRERGQKLETIVEQQTEPYWLTEASSFPRLQQRATCCLR